jgi:hypothetical protein
MKRDDGSLRGGGDKKIRGPSIPDGAGSYNIGRQYEGFPVAAEKSVAPVWYPRPGPPPLFLAVEKGLKQTLLPFTGRESTGLKIPIRTP